MRAKGINHVSIAAADLEESTRFYETVFGMERIATPVFETPVQWLRCGDMQLHLFLDTAGEPAPARHHLGLTIDDLAAAYETVSRWSDAEWGARIVELPSRQIQLYFRDPAGNLIELNCSSDGVDLAGYPELRVLADWVPQTDESLRAVLYLREPVVA